MGNQDAGGNDKQKSKDGDECQENCDKSVRNSLEVWCICRIVKPCTCEKRKVEDRDITPTPGDSETSHEEEDSDPTTPTPRDSGKGEKCKNCENSFGFKDKLGINYSDKWCKENKDDIAQQSGVEKIDEIKHIIEENQTFEKKSKQEIIDEFDDCVSKLHTIANSDFELHVWDIDTGNNFRKDLVKNAVTDKVKQEEVEKEYYDKEHSNGKERKITEKRLDSVSEGEMDPSRLDSISLSSFDHLDASFCSLKSTGNYL